MYAPKLLTTILVLLLLPGAGALAVASSSESSTSGGQWELRGGNAEGQHFSPLHQIDDKTIDRLGLAWYADIPSVDGPVGTPIVVNGVSYLIGTGNRVFAHDLRTGKIVWTFDPELQFSRTSIAQNWGARVKRGVAYADGKIFASTGDCRLIAIDAKLGTRVWQTQVCPREDDYSITAAPRVGGGMVFVGPSNMDSGTRRGYVDAYDVKTGERRWRFHTIPGDPEDAGKPWMAMAARTWDPNHQPGGGSAWEDITYDAVTGLVYIGVGGPSPFNPPDRGPKRGDELFTNSIVALEAKSGRYVWHFQTTPGDGWNYEPVMPMVLADLKIGESVRHVLMEAPKNGFFYVIDALTGKLVNKPRNFVPVNWAREIDEKTGRPVLTHEADYWEKPDGAVVMPSPLGAHSWNPMSYSPATGLVYIPALEHAARMRIDHSDTTKVKVDHPDTTAFTAWGGSLQIDWLYDLKDFRAPLIAWDPVKQTSRWSKGGLKAGGVLSTAGNLVFAGSADGLIHAYRATDGAELWSYDTGGAIAAAPVTVNIEGAQLLVVVSGRPGMSNAWRTLPQLYSQAGVNGPPRLMAFRLDGHASAPPRSESVAFQKPPLPRPDPTLAERGRLAFDSQGCDLCHGAEAQALTGSVPDLRRATAATYAQLAGIVKDGMLSSAGMPAFGDKVSNEDLAAIQALMLKSAWDAYDAESPHAKKP